MLGLGAVMVRKRLRKKNEENAVFGYLTRFKIIFSEFSDFGLEQMQHISDTIQRVSHYSKDGLGASQAKYKGGRQFASRNFFIGRRADD